jgi:uncharacterized membrane protein
MPPETTAKRAVRVILGLSMIVVGVLHFAQPDGFVKIVPSWLPTPLLLVQISGFFEVLGGVGILVERVHRAAAYGLMALYVAVFPANINMAIHDIQPADHPIPQALLWARLPFQMLFIGLAWWLSRSPSKSTPSKSAG